MQSDTPSAPYSNAAPLHELGAARSGPLGGCVHHVVDRWAVETPDAVALVTTEESLTYAELRARSSQLAHYLLDQGAEPGSRIGVRLPRSINAVVSFLAVLKAGCAYVPLDPSYPPDRLAFMTEDAQLALTITTDLLASRKHTIAAYPAEAPATSTSGDDIAYVIYTSGSTGKPKGVQIRHTSILDLIMCADYADFGPNTRFMHSAAISFDAAVWEVWTPLLWGGRLVVAPPGALSAQQIGETIRQHQVTDAFLPSASFHRQMEEDPEAVAELRTLAVGAESVRAEYAKAALAVNEKLRLIHAYGPTEATVYCTYHVMDGVSDVEDPVPIGRATPNTRLRVLGLDGRTLQPGERGELYVGGPGVAAGYLNRPEQTNERFIPDPDYPGDYLYRTGDLVRWRPDGALVFCGRVDQQVKLHGYRIEPGEIEAALCRHPDVAQALVIKREDLPGRPYLAGYLVPNGNSGASEDFRTFLSRLLPTHMIPAAFEVIDSFPLTVNGKIDPAALPVPERKRDSTLGCLIEAGSPLERELHEIWRDILGFEVSVRDGFTAAGGDSLSAMRAVTAIESRFGVRLPLSMLFPDGTISGLAALIEDLRVSRNDRAATSFPLAPRDFVPATNGQQGLWFHDQALPGSAVYSEVLSLRLRGRLDRAVLQQCLQRLVDRHEPLRTGFFMGCSMLEQSILHASQVILEEVDLRALPSADREQLVAQEVRRLAGRPFDLAAGPYFRSYLIRVTDTESVLVMSTHHTAIDGWSANILFEELGELYRSLLSNEEPSLAPPAVQFADFAVWQHGQLMQDAFAADRAYWKKRLSGVPDFLALPGDFARAGLPTGEGALIHVVLPDELAERVDQLARSSGVTRYMILLAVFSLLLARYADTEDVVVGTPAAGRLHSDLQRTVGYFINMLPMRTSLTPDLSFLDLLLQVRTTVLEAYAHQQLPFSDIVRSCGIDSESLTPLVQVALVPEDVYRHSFLLNDDLTAEFEYHDLGISKLDLTLALIPETASRPGFRINAEFRTDLFHASTIEKMLHQAVTLLQSAVTEPNKSASELSMISPGEQARICGGFDGTPQAVPDSGCVHHVVDRWAVETPDAVALVTAEESLTYAELRARSSQLAHYLLDQGAEPGSRIGVRLPRSINAVVSFLAVLKAGCAYVPLDPSYPPDRLAFMTEDAQLALTITTDLLASRKHTIAAYPAEAPATSTSGDDIAYVIYTSGSTGKPKGVQIRHTSILDLISGSGIAQVDASSRFLHSTSVSFDLTTFEVWLTLTSGAQLVILSPTSPTVDDIAQIIASHSITHACIATALFHRQAEHAPATFTDLQTLVVGGEALSPDLARTVLAASPGLRLINGYGPTEATVYATFHLLTHPDQVTDPVLIGRPTPNTRARVLSPGGQLQPIGCAGELHLGGPSLAASYLNRPQLTEERFVPDPEHPGERLYRTGDLVRWKPDGMLAYCGRIDQQIKLHGYRIEPGEIEAVLRLHPDVADVHVLKREDQPGYPYLAAYYTTVSGGSVTSHDLTRLAASRLPTYMVPRICVPLDQFPLTVNGKLDRASLPLPGRPARSPQSSPPSKDRAIEEEIATIWQRVVMADAIDLDERLFDIGGASVHVARIHQLVTERFGLPALRMVDLFTHPTVRTYSRHIRTLLESS
ncbi:amino acid adenylation domain-containing protein [Streptomyces sp. NPDC053431]|uniref:amino acid adenylation domain-containing protein n=1 Tax=Streptomyces sp. NPDC053431 TaxID=3365703 RepID=UPI0037D4B52A